MDNPLITDEKFDEIGRRLVRLQKKYPHIAESIELHEDFKDWDGSTGFHLKSLYNPEYLAIASHLLKLSSQGGQGGQQKKNNKIKISLYNV